MHQSLDQWRRPRLKVWALTLPRGARAGKTEQVQTRFQGEVGARSLKGDKSNFELAQIFGAHLAQSSARKKQLLESTRSVIKDKRTAKSDAFDIDELNKKIGKLGM